MHEERIYLDFEEPIKSLDIQMKELDKLSSQKGISFSEEIRSLQKKQFKELKITYNNLTAWQTVQVSRHSQRPILQDYIEYVFNDFVELHGDKCFGDDRALITGFAKIHRANFYEPHLKAL